MLTSRVRHGIKLPVDRKKYLGTDIYECTCFGDTEDKNTFYVLPQTIVYQNNGPDPVFQFYKYRDTDLNGGYAQFTVKLPYPDSDLQSRIKLELQGDGVKNAVKISSVTAVNYCAARKELEADPQNATLLVASQQAFNVSGLSQAKADEFYLIYNGNPEDKEQFISHFMPDGDINLREIDFRDVKASLILNKAEEFFKTLPSSIEASGSLDNVAIFDLNLDKKGATLFEEILKTDGGPAVGVIYEVTFDSNIPAATVTVDYQSEVMKSISEEIDYNTWSADEQIVERKYSESGVQLVNAQVFISKEDMGMDADAYDKWKKGLSDWGQEQLQQILTNQTGFDMSMELLNDKEGVDKFKSSVTNTQNITREYSENTVLQYTRKPQNQLKSIRDIVGEENLDKFFKVYDLDDPFYRQLEPEFIVNGDFEKYDVANVVVKVTYDNDPKTLVFTEGSGERKKVEPWFKDENLPEPNNYHYEYTVSFRSGGKAYHSGELDANENLVINLNVSNSGVVLVDFQNPTPEVWDIFENIELSGQYKDHFFDKQSVTEKVPAIPFIYPTGEAQTEPVFYQMKFHTKSGSDFYFLPSGDEANEKPGYGKTLGQKLFLPNPLPVSRKMEVIFIDYPEDTKLLKISFNIDYFNYKFVQVVSATVTDFSEAVIFKNVEYYLMNSDYNDQVSITYEVTHFGGDGSVSLHKGIIPVEKIKALSGKPTIGPNDIQLIIEYSAVKEKALVF